MKSIGTIEAGTGLWASPNTGATNESGFTAVPAGYRGPDGAFGYINREATWWSSSVLSFWGTGWTRFLYSSMSEALRSDFDKSSGFSVRCLRD